MKKLITITILATLLSSCDSNIITLSSTCNSYIITEIKRFDDSNKRAKYIATTYADYIYYKDDIVFVDTIGKYVIGDSVKAEFVKLTKWNT